MFVLKKNYNEIDDVVRYLEKRNRRNIVVTATAAASLGALIGIAGIYLTSGNFRNETNYRTKGIIAKFKDAVQNAKNNMRNLDEEKMEAFDIY